ncbi:hypothetical protein KIW84_UN0597 [Lathyrus oleraceus]|nr:hypothetical protein KIW84_UN0597 [Pisum sativum]
MENGAKERHHEWKGNIKAHQLLEQKELTLDASDYLWYMTSVDINDTSIWSNATLSVNTMGHTLHGYVNRRYIGYQFSQWGNKFTYEKKVSLKNGTNIITLLSATVGLANYGAWFDEIKTGISGGPVQLIGKIMLLWICQPTFGLIRQSLKPLWNKPYRGGLPRPR